MSARARNSGALALESLAQPNLLVVDWQAMVEANISGPPAPGPLPA
jgi:hypothetical protein